jgi:hypothetical protein
LTIKQWLAWFGNNTFVAGAAFLCASMWVRGVLLQLKARLA